MIKERWKLSELFQFKQVNIAEVLHQLEQLNSKKASPINSIPAKVLREMQISLLAPWNVALMLA